MQSQRLVKNGQKVGTATLMGTNGRVDIAVDPEVADTVCVKMMCDGVAAGECAPWTWDPSGVGLIVGSRLHGA